MIYKDNKRKRHFDYHKWIPYILMFPMLFLLYVYVLRPTVMGTVFSFFRMQGFTVKEFCGFDNYIKVLTHTQFFPILLNTLEYVFWSLVVGFIPPFIIAVMLNEVVHGRTTLRLLIYLPVIIPGIAAMLMWSYVYFPDETGLLNMFFNKIGFEPYEWLNDPKFTILGIIIYSTWKSFPSAMLLYFAALQGVRSDVHEAAIIDGAGPWKRLWNVSIPSVEGILLLNLVNQIIGVFQTYETPLAMTGGGPNGASTTLGYQLYQYGFNSGGKGTGQAMALGVIIFLILIGCTIFYFWLNKKVEERR